MPCIYGVYGSRGKAFLGPGGYQILKADALGCFSSAVDAIKAIGEWQVGAHESLALLLSGLALGACLTTAAAVLPEPHDQGEAAKK
jgi:hypothetical protein